MHIRFRTLLAASGALALAVPFVATAGDGERTLTIGADQVVQGAAAYQSACADCHGAALEGMAHFPQLVGGPFRNRWSDRPVGDLHTYVATQMPLGAGGTLSDEAYAAIVAYLLERNGLEPGEAPFDPADAAVLELELTFGD
jgi:mono/diheme cytochrome c family protein